MRDPLLKTARLLLRKTLVSDAAAYLQLYNEPCFIHNIRDKKLRTLEDVERDLETTFANHYEEHGYGLLSMQLEDGTCIGQCGLVKRPELDIPEIGFALLSQYHNQGYVTEAAHEVLRYAFEDLQLQRLAGLVKPDNMASIRILTKLNMKFIKGFKIVDYEPQVKYFELTRDAYLQQHTGEDS